DTPSRSSTETARCFTVSLMNLTSVYVFTDIISQPGKAPQRAEGTNLKAKKRQIAQVLCEFCRIM
ncbi:MAG: hypothetical protein IJ313_09700, partial [Clostridia bacterium]|nr:hypothetical protein [Clostridia bacterium]